MADWYEPGIVRIYYKSTGFKPDFVVTADVFLPGGTWVDGVGVDNIGNGVYCLEYEFVKEGSYLAIFAEDGVKKTIRQFDIKWLVRETSTRSRTIVVGDGGNLINL